MKTVNNVTTKQKVPVMQFFARIRSKKTCHIDNLNLEIAQLQKRCFYIKYIAAIICLVASTFSGKVQVKDSIADALKFQIEKAKHYFKRTSEIQKNNSIARGRLISLNR